MRSHHYFLCGLIACLPASAATLTYPEGTTVVFNPSSTLSGLNVGAIAGDPSAPVNGDIWYDSTANELTARINGANVALGSGSGSGNALTTDPLSQFAATTSAQLKSVLSDELGDASGKAIFALGTLAISSGKTLTASNTLTLAGTDGSTLNIGAGGTLGAAALLGTSTGGNGILDDGLAVVFDASGYLRAEAVLGDNGLFVGEVSTTSGLIYLYSSAHAFESTIIPNSGLGADEGYILPGDSGTLATEEWVTANGAAFDATAVDAVTWSDGANASNVWTFNLSGTDPAITFASGAVNVSTGALQVAGVVVPTISSTSTLTNKRITQRVETLTDAATVTINIDNADCGTLATLSQTTTFGAPTGTPTAFQVYKMSVTSSTARTISFNAAFDDSDDMPFPTATSGGGKTDLLIGLATTALAPMLPKGDSISCRIGTAAKLPSA